MARFSVSIALHRQESRGTLLSMIRSLCLFLKTRNQCHPGVLSLMEIFLAARCGVSGRMFAHAVSNKMGSV